jgi:hypothetical protein
VPVVRRPITPLQVLINLYRRAGSAGGGGREVACATARTVMNAAAASVAV